MILTLHAGLSRTTWLFFLIIGLWGIVRGLQKKPVDGAYFGSLLIGEILFVLQGVFGFILWAQGLRPGRAGIHLLYGIFALLFLPFTYGILRGDESNRAQWVFAFATLFLFGVALRTIETS